MGKAKQVSWRDAKPDSIVFVSGPEECLADRAIRSIRDQLKTLDAGLEVHELLAGVAPGGANSSCEPVVHPEGVKRDPYTPLKPLQFS